MPPLLGAANDVDIPSILVPDEAALAAAAAAMAAAAAAQSQADQQHTADHNVVVSDALDSYLLAAAAASVHAQQQHSTDAAQKNSSEDSLTFAATPGPDRLYTNGTSIGSSDTDEVRAAILDQCRKYTDEPAPFPLTIGKRTPGGCAQVLADGSSQSVEQLPLTEAQVELGKTRCYWALLSADYSQGNGPTGEKLQFVYLDPVLQQHMAEQAIRMVGSDFYDYVHPEERERVSADMQKIVDSRTLFGSVTRCRYSRIPHIRELLGAINPPRDPEADRYVEDDSFVAIDIVINWIGDGMLLCFFHAIIDKSAEDNDEQHKSDWTNWCGTPGNSFSLRQCDTIWKQVKASPRETLPDFGPDHVFQVIEAGGDSRVLLSWPPPRFFSRQVKADLLAQSDVTAFQDGSYFADDFARLAQGVSIAPGSSSLSDANTSCTRRFRAKHTLTTEGKVRNIESVLIPYGSVILACFHTTFQQQLPPPEDLKLVSQAQAELQAPVEGRKAEYDGSQDSPNKRQRMESETLSGLPMSDGTQVDKKATVPTPAPTSSRLALSAASLVSSTPKGQTYASTPPNGHATHSNGHSAKTANGHPSRPTASKHHRSTIKAEGSGISALANPSLMYTNAPAKSAVTPTSTARLVAERKSSTTSAQKGTNGLSNGTSSPSPAAAVSGDYSPGANKACTGCGKVNSPEWRRGPSGHKTLCNACGLRYARSLTRRKKKKGKDGEVEFIEPTGDPTVVPKSRGGGGGSLPGVHRKNSKKRKEEEAAKAAAAAAAAAAVGATTGATIALLNGSPAAAVTGSTSSTSPSATSATQSPTATAAPIAISPSPTKVDEAKPAASAETPSTVKDETAQSGAIVTEDNSLTATSSLDSKELASMPAFQSETTDPVHSIAVSNALDAIAQASPSAPLMDADALSVPVSNAISRALAATIESTDVGSIATNDSLHIFQSVSSDTADDVTVPSSDSCGTPHLESAIRSEALQTIKSVVSEALYKQLVQTSFPEPPRADTDMVDVGTNPTAAERDVDLTDALTADAIRAAAQAAVAHGVTEV